METSGLDSAQYNFSVGVNFSNYDSLSIKEWVEDKMKDFLIKDMDKNYMFFETSSGGYTGLGLEWRMTGTPSFRHEVFCSKDP